MPVQTWTIGGRRTRGDGVGGDVGGDNGMCTDNGPIPDSHTPENCSACADHHVGTEDWLTRQTAIAQSHPVIEPKIGSRCHARPNHDSNAVNETKTGPNVSERADLGATPSNCSGLQSVGERQEAPTD